MSRVLVVSPSTFGYEKRITDIVSKLGHDAFWHDERVGNDFLSKVLTRLQLLRLITTVREKHLRSILDCIEIKRVEILLLINPETLGWRELKLIRQANPKLKIVIYKWDSLKQKPIDDQVFEYANKVYSFDPEDCRRSKELVHLPLFHGHSNNSMSDAKNGNGRYEFLFVGTAQFHRIRVLAKLLKCLNEANRSHYFLLVSQSPIHHVAYSIVSFFFGYKGVLTKKSINYKEYLDLIEQSLCVVDVEYPKQSGLTMRSIEVVFSNSAIMTTNSSIWEYDLSRVGGVFVFEPNSPILPDRESLLQHKNPELFDKYSLDTWAAVLLSMGEGLYWDGERWY